MFPRVVRPVFGPALASAVTPATDYVLDYFTGANGTDIPTAHTPDVSPSGALWVAPVGAWQITGNQAYNPTFTNGAYNYMQIESGVSDGTIQADYTMLTANLNAGGFIVRWSDASNYWMLLAFEDLTNILRIVEVNGGSATTRAQVAYTAPAHDTQVPILATLSGASISFTISGTTISYSSSFNQTATKHGLVNYRDGAYFQCLFDNFRIPIP